jgi:hypothetical protein
VVSPVPSGRQAGQHDRFLSLADAEYDGGEAFSCQGSQGLKDWEQPEVINTDKAPTYAAALTELKAKGKCAKDTQHRQVKYLNNIVEYDLAPAPRATEP